MKTLLSATALSIALSAGLSEAAIVKSVTFNSQGQTLAGDLYLPDDYRPGQKLPAVVVTGSWTSVKEQMAGLYAEHLADRGYAALAFDFRGWGESKDAKMFLEDPTRKTEDVIAAANFLSTRREIDAKRIGGLGICASAGYIADAALASEDIRSIALVAPWLHDAAIVDAVYGGSEGVAQLIKLGRQAEAEFAANGKLTTVPAASTTDNTAVMFQAPYYTEPERGLIPEYDNQFNVATWEPWLTYDAIQTSTKLTKSTLLVHSESAAIPQGAKQFAANMGEHATALWLDDKSQFDFYDNPQTVASASDAVVSHFNINLK